MAAANVPVETPARFGEQDHIGGTGRIEQVNDLHDDVRIGAVYGDGQPLPGIEDDLAETVRPLEGGEVHAEGVASFEQSIAVATGLPG